MTQPGRAAIEIVGDASKLGPQLERDAQRAIDNVDIDTTNISRQIGDGFREGADEAVEAFARAQDFLGDFFESIDRSAEETADNIAVHFEDGGARIVKTFRDGRKESDGFFDGVGDGARDAADDVRSNFLRPLTAGFSRLGEAVTSAGSALAGIGLTGTNPLGLATLALTAAAIAAALPVILGLAAALADLAGFVTLLPAAIGGAAASIIVLTVAFNGFGDAISAVLEGDPEKIAEAMERLAPAARVIVQEFQRILPIFREVGKEIQQGFFIQLNGILERFGTATLPRLRDELKLLSNALGSALAGLGTLLNEAENVGILERLLTSTARITENLGEAFRDLGQAFFNSIDAGLPSLEALSARLADAISGFADFINASIADGSFQAFLDDAVATLDELLNLGGAVGELLGVLFSGTDDAGRGFIATLTDVTQRLTEFFKSAEGQDALEDFGEIMDAVGIILGVGVNILRDLIDIFTELDDIVNETIETVQALGLGMAEAWDIITGAVSTAVSAVGQFFSDLGSDIADTWNDAVEVVSGAIDTIISFVESIPGRVTEFVESIPDRISAAFDAVADQVINIVGTLIAGVIALFTDMPGQIIGALTAFLVSVRETFIGARDGAVESLTSIGAFIQSVPSLLASAWEAVVLQVVATFTTVKDFITTTWESLLAFISTIPGRVGAFFQQMNDAVVARITALVAFVKGIPAQVLAAIGNLGRLLYNAGANVIQGLIDGISSRIGQLRDKISSAVQTIRDHLPFSPAKTGPLSGNGSPQIAGAVIAEMIAAGLDAGTPLISQAAGRAASASTSPFGAIGQAGVTPLTSPPGTPGGDSVMSPVGTSTELQPVFIVRIGDEDIEAFIDKRVDERVQVETRRLLAGVRGI